MLVIVGLVSCISAALSAPVGEDNSTYILATVLFYKDAKGQIMIANGAVPDITHYTIKDDILTRVKGAHVKVVPIFHDRSAMPRSLNVLDFIKDEYDTVFVTEVPKRLTRNFAKDLWHYYWHGVLEPKNKPTKKENSQRLSDVPEVEPESNITETRKGRMNRVKLPVGFKDRNMVTYKPSTNSQTIQPDVTKPVNSLKKSTTIAATNKSTKKNSTNDDPNKTRVLTSADEFIPNDIYYGIEKKCVNWSDGCDHRSKNVLDMSSTFFRYVYKRPRIVQWRP